jgi:hypothetical protein
MFVKMRLDKNHLNAIQLTTPLKIETDDGRTKREGFVGDWLVMDDWGCVVMIVEDFKFFSLFEMEFEEENVNKIGKLAKENR